MAKFYPVQFYARKDDLFGWWIYSIYEDGIHRRVLPRPVWRKWTAERIVLALIQHYRNGHDMGRASAGHPPLYKLPVDAVIE